MTAPPPRRSLTGAAEEVLPTDRHGTRVAAGEAHPKLLKCVRSGGRVTLISGTMSCGE